MIKINIILGIALLGIYLPTLAGDNFTIRFPASGTQAEEGSSLGEVGNISMCKEESKTSQRVYNKTNKTYVLRKDNTRKYPGGTNPDVWYLYIDNATIMTKTGYAANDISNKLESLGYERLNQTTDLEETRKTSRDFGRIKHTYYYFSLKEVVASEKYQWCVDNGYETLN